MRHHQAGSFVKHSAWVAVLGEGSDARAGSCLADSLEFGHGLGNRKEFCRRGCAKQEMPLSNFSTLTDPALFGFILFEGREFLKRNADTCAQVRVMSVCFSTGRKGIWITSAH